MIRQSTIAMIAVAAVAMSTAASANAPRLGEGFSQFSRTFAQHDTAIETLRRGQQAQNTRVTLRMETRQGREAGRAIAANRETLRQRGDIARHARLKPAYTKTLQNTGNKTVRFASQAQVKTYSVNRPMRPTKGVFETRTRGAGTMTTKQARALNKSKAQAMNVSRQLQKQGKVAQAARRTTSAAKAAKMVKTAQAAKVAKVAKAAKTARTANKTAKVAKTAKALKNVKALAGGAGTMVAESLLGTDIPDPFEAAAWTINTLKDPKNAPKAIAKLGQDAVKTVGEIGKTITNPKKLAENTVKTAKTVGKVAEDVGKRVAFAFTNPEQAAKNTTRDIGNAAKTVGCAIISIFGGCR